MKPYTIKEISNLFQLPTSTLRYYEEVGILTDIARTDSGQRIYEEKHVNRLKTICCFKQTGMTISQLQAFFSYEEKEQERIDDILSLLEQQRENVENQLAQLQNAYEHVKRKLNYYGDIKQAITAGFPIPNWDAYREKTYNSHDG
ncbi:MerR family transcriptional regulator [Clostridium sp. D33t1_170424_F3]|uniref:MerR family transcriptional regulator n=1 Tax=Clostridium sp. D33t1_170424_F3 TaxID=2787099 RepID=UPI0018A89B74|nr:MerR family transcriptional regulator [Clostridium sp. D33t1_170424_F3]